MSSSLAGRLITVAPRNTLKLISDTEIKYQGQILRFPAFLNEKCSKVTTSEHWDTATKMYGNGFGTLRIGGDGMHDYMLACRGADCDDQTFSRQVLFTASIFGNAIPGKLQNITTIQQTLDYSV